MTLINPTIDQAKIQSWEETFIALASQKDSYLSNLPAVRYTAFEGKQHNFPRHGSFELNETKGRNPDKQYDEMLFDNRQLKRKRYTKTLIFDNMDIREMMADPTSPAYQEFTYAINRAKDRIIAEAATADVNVGDPNNNVALTKVSFENDGGITIDATTNLTYDILKKAQVNFINNKVSIGDLSNSNSSLICGGTDFSQLLSEDKFINNLYSTFRPAMDGKLTRVLGMNVVALPGSETGSITDANPILKEDGTTRDCLLLAENSIAFSMENLKITYIPSMENKVDSSSLTVSVEMGAMRLEGARVQKIQTTF